jgi:hypothetical protein
MSGRTVARAVAPSAAARSAAAHLRGQGYVSQHGFAAAWSSPPRRGIETASYGRDVCAPVPGRAAADGDLDDDRRHPAPALRPRSDEGQDVRARRHRRRGHAGKRLHSAGEDDHGQRQSRPCRRDAPRLPACHGRALQPGDRRADRSQVVAFLSQAHVDPDITMEIFFVDRPLDGFGAVEVIEPGLPRRGLLSRDAPSESPRAAELRSYVVSRAPRQAVPSREEKGAPRSDWRCRRRMRTRRRAEAADSESRAHLGSRARHYFPIATVLKLGVASRQRSFSAVTDR